MQIGHALDHLIVHDGRIGVDEIEVARWLAYTFIAADKASWANFREVGLYEVTAPRDQSGTADRRARRRRFLGHGRSIVAQTARDRQRCGAAASRFDFTGHSV